jgi:nitrate/TMAO reductase-like tetraheme cytochrome c subunit
MRPYQRLLERWKRLGKRWRIAVVAGVSLFIVGSSVAGYRQWHYMQHDNRFCTSCHLMQDPFERFNRSAHARLECHDCHEAKLSEQIRQLYLTLVERPTEIGGHADVPNQVCGRCHIEGDSTRWRIIAGTAGHRVHLESRAPALRGGLRCVVCHAVSVHEFASVDRTCGQSGCHATNTIRLGRMGQASELHCTTCHSFLAEARTVALDSLGQPLTPTAAECLACHAMQELMQQLEISLDPHRGVCGDCHNPHRQTSPQQVGCATSSCHTDWRSVSFHVGVPHPERCTGCHLPHSWRIEGQQCLRCHRDIERERPTRGSRTASATGVTIPAVVATLASASTDQPWTIASHQDPPGRTRDLPRFSHGDHRSQTCSSCHSSRVRHGELLVRSARDCQRCHHAGPSREQCAACHRTVGRRPGAAPERSLALIAGNKSVTRRIRFDHDRHAQVACTRCHADALTRAPAVDCASCHAPHHRPEAACTTCHAGANALAAHTRADHPNCATAACHGQRGANLPASREACLVCHASQANHQPGKLCDQCHRVVAREAAPS